MSKVLLFSTSTCSWCRRAKRYFKERGIPFKEINIERDADAARDMVRKTGQTGVPVIKIGSRWIVGFDKERIDKELARKASQELAVHAAKLDAQHLLQAYPQCAGGPAGVSRRGGRPYNRYLQWPCDPRSKLAAARIARLGETIGEEDNVRYGVSVPNFGIGVDARAIAELARQAEEADWDGFFLWDHLLAFSPGPVPVVDPWVALTAIALSTSRVWLGPMVTPLPRRRPAKLARETASLDHLSGGRLILGVGIGAMPYEYDYLGEEVDMRVRGAMLDEGLEVLTGLWSGEPFGHRGEHYRVAGGPPEQEWRAIFYPPPLQRPRIPIWVGGTWPIKVPFRRAARWDGAFPMKVEGRRIVPMTPEDAWEVAHYVADHRARSDPIELVVAGETLGEDRKKAARLVTAYEEAGVTWWIESIDPWRFGWTEGESWPSEEMRRRVRQGPPEA